MLETPDALTLDDLRNLAVALAIGFLIGFQREHTHVAEARAHSFAGARTFTLVAFSGALAGLLDAGHVLPGAALVVIGVLTIVAYHAATREEPGGGALGGTTEIAIFVTFLLGLAAARDHLLIAATGGVGVAIILSVKHRVQRLAQTLSEKEIFAVLRLLAISVVILPVLPNQGYGPYGALNPAEIWLMVVFISALSFLGYWLIKLVGADKGFLWTGLAGGLASSTATTLSLARFAAGGANPVQVGAGVIVANIVMLARVGVLLLAVAREMLLDLWPVLAAAGLAGAGFVFFIRRAGGKGESDNALELGNPMEIKPALIFAGLLAVIALASRFGADQFGGGGLVVVGLLSGLADVDAMTLTAGRQAASGDVALAASAAAILAAVLANIVVKAGMAWSVGGARVGLRVTSAFVVMVGAGLGVYLAL